MLTRVSPWLILLAGLAAFFTPSAAWAQAKPAAAAKTKIPPTTVYLVRHAEKDSTSDPLDPTLSVAGQLRAQALRQTLAKHHPVALFTTDTKRTRATLAPLADALKLEPQVYDAKYGHDLADRILKEYAGKTVVVVGHSNTILPFIDDLGGTAPVDEIGENEYDYLFTVRVAPGLQPTVGMGGYGAERKPAAKASAKAAPKATPPAPVK
ncbi:SixA phosphatase family protein [Hymenobacter rubidus]|uniref:SixA phosphatase family protein n=1 Tax=Hymenobacter rubidus TaxID=1441626 RepID=UPI00191F99A5|nr:histidine phosphatase family protein [Hymenobacter rubidus]